MLERRILRAVPSDHDNQHSNDVETLLRRLMVGKSELTQKTYWADLEAFGRFLGFPRPEPGVGRLLIGGAEYAYGLLLDYVESLKKMGLQNASINKKIAPIRSALSLAKSIGLIDWQARSQYLKTEAYRDTRGPGSAGWKRLISDAESRQDAKGVRDQAILRLLHDMALRRNEVRTLDLEDVDQINSRISILGKGRSQKETLDVPTRVMAAIAAWLEFRGTAPGPLFITLDRKALARRRMLRQGSNAILPDGRTMSETGLNFGEESRICSASLSRLVKKMGASCEMKVTPHALRHAGITSAVAKAAEIGVTIPEIMQFSRHKHLKTLQIYVDQHRNVQGRIAEAVSTA